MILLTNKEPSIHSSKTPFESYSSEQKYVPWVKVGSAKLNPLLLCIANTYKYYIFWIHKRGGNIFHHILDVLIPLKIGHEFSMGPSIHLILKKKYLEQHWHHHYRESGKDIVGTDGGLLLYKIRIGFQLKSRQSHSCLTSDWR